MLRILVTGANGRLGTELKKHLEATYVDIQDFDFTDELIKNDYDLIIHMGAYTDVRKAEIEKKKCFMDNAYGTFNLVNVYKDVPFVYISTEYANKPLGVYALTKRLGEDIVLTHKKYLILRTSFKPTPFPFPYAYEDQMTQGDYVNIIAKILAERVKNWDRVTCRFEYLGTGRKSMYQLAKRTRPDVLPNKVEEYNAKIGMELIPHDYLDEIK